MSEAWIYEERLTSNKTEALFVSLAALFLLLFVWRMAVGEPGLLAVIFFVFFCFFAFYSLNYRRLLIRLNHEALSLKFGLFRWKVPLENIAGGALDELPALLKYGGAGIHFMNVRKRYRASFNFLEYPRIVIALERSAGPVRDISFSTRHPEKLLSFLQQAISTRKRS